VLQLCAPYPFIWFQRSTELCATVINVHDCEFAPPTQPPPTSTTLSTTTTTTRVTTEPPSGVSPIECPSTGVSKHPNPTSCTRFFMCFDGVAIERQCSPGLYFSRAQLRCVRRDDSDCSLDNNACPLENDPNNVVFLPDQENCQKYFICYDGEPQEFDCGESLHWDPNNNWCIREEDSQCEPSYPLPPIREIECPEDTSSDIIFLPHPEDCHFYFICIDGTSILARCARNFLFDYIIEKCFFADQARCFNRNPFLDFIQ
jgi:hypothetical protein